MDAEKYINIFKIKNFLKKKIDERIYVPRILKLYYKLLIYGKILPN